MGTIRQHDEAEPLTWRRREVERVTGLGTTTLYKLIAAGTFPRGRRVEGCPGVVYWLRADIRRWLEDNPPADPADRPAKGRPAAGGAGPAADAGGPE